MIAEAFFGNIDLEKNLQLQHKPSTSKSFSLLSDRQKRRRTEYLKDSPEEHVEYVAQKNMKPNIQYILNFLTEHPEHADEIKKFCQNLIDPSSKDIKLSREKALAVYVGADLSKKQYNIIRAATHVDVFPSYYQIQKAKSECYPEKESITITETSVKIKLQALLNKTTIRLLKSINFEKSRDNLEPRSYTLIIKWGFVGASDQAEYNIQFENENGKDNSVFISTLVPIKLHSNDSNVVLWQNLTPSSTTLCRPIHFYFNKESEELVKSVKNEIEREIGDLEPTLFEDAKIYYKMLFTMADVKIINILTNTKSAVR